jgi:hypothetical protein
MSTETQARTEFWKELAALVFALRRLVECVDPEDFKRSENDAGNDA